jgi:chromosome segregation ATPase
MSISTFATAASHSPLKARSISLRVVSAIPADQIKRFVEENKARVRAQLERLRKTNEARGAEVAAAQRAYDEAKKTVDDLTAQKEAVSSRQSELNSSSQPYLDALTEEDLGDSPALKGALKDAPERPYRAPHSESQRKMINLTLTVKSDSYQLDISR